MEVVVRRAKRLEGDVRVPGDKSVSHRAALFNAVARGTAHITNFLAGADCRATIACLRALGVRIKARRQEGQDGLELFVSGVGYEGLIEPQNVLGARNSGTTLRLLAGLLATRPFLSVITGDSSLRNRPVGRVVEPLRLMGAEVHARQGDRFPPLVLRGGALRGTNYALPVSSAQVKSAILLAGLCAEGSTTVVDPGRSRDHSERLLQAMGARLEKRTHGEGEEVRVYPLTRPLVATDVAVPGDFSSAAFWLVAAAAHPQARLRLRGVGLNPTRTGLLEVLREMGARLHVEEEHMEGGEPVGDIVVESSSLRAASVGGSLIPRLIDEVPVLAVAATQAEGTTYIREAGELRVKESDRLRSVAVELGKMGARVEELPDGLVVRGPSRLRGACLSSWGDHRLAMALGVAALLAEGETVIAGAEVVEVSYPGFWQTLARLAGRGQE